MSLAQRQPQPSTPQRRRNPKRRVNLEPNLTIRPPDDPHTHADTFNRFLEQCQRHAILHLQSPIFVYSHVVSFAHGHMRASWVQCLDDTDRKRDCFSDLDAKKGKLSQLRGHQAELVLMNTPNESWVGKSGDWDKPWHVWAVLIVHAPEGRRGKQIMI